MFRIETDLYEAVPGLRLHELRLEGGQAGARGDQVRGHRAVWHQHRRDESGPELEVSLTCHYIYRSYVCSGWLIVASVSSPLSRVTGPGPGWFSLRSRDELPWRIRGAASLETCRQASHWSGIFPRVSDWWTRGGTLCDNHRLTLDIPVIWNKDFKIKISYLVIKSQIVININSSLRWRELERRPHLRREIYLWEFVRWRCFCSHPSLTTAAALRRGQPARPVAGLFIFIRGWKTWRRLRGGRVINENFKVISIA